MEHQLIPLRRQLIPLSRQLIPLSRQLILLSRLATLPNNLCIQQYHNLNHLHSIQVLLSLLSSFINIIIASVVTIQLVLPLNTHHQMLLHQVILSNLVSSYLECVCVAN